MSGVALPVVWLALLWAGVVGVVGVGAGPLLRRRSLRWTPAWSAVVAVLAIVAAELGAASAMYISDHDAGVALTVSIVGGVVALGFALLVGRDAVRALDDLTEQARRFGDADAFSASRRGPAELETLAVALATTSRRLADERERSERSEGARRDLVSWVSHDLRTPLAGLRAMTEALEDGIAADPGDYHARMLAEVDRMVRMVDDLFDLSRIHAGVLPVQPEDLVLADVVSEAIASAQPVAARRDVLVSGEVAPEVTVRADPHGLTRVLANLVSNAVRHSADGSEVRIVGRRRDGGEVEVGVSDSCGGIPTDDLARVFELAWRGSAARSPGGGADAGAGLGLAIVAGIVEAHGGEVGVTNVPAAPGASGAGGCRFTVVFPDGGVSAG